MIRSWCSPLPQERNSRSRQTDSPLVPPLPSEKNVICRQTDSFLVPASVPWKKLNCIRNWFTLGAHPCPMKEIKLYYELIRSLCPPPPHERNSIVLRIEPLLVPASVPWNKLNQLYYEWKLIRSCCLLWSTKETPWSVELIRSWCPPLSAMIKRNQMPQATVSFSVATSAHQGEKKLNSLKYDSLLIHP